MRYGDKAIGYYKNCRTGERKPYDYIYKYADWNGYHTNSEGDGLWCCDRQILGTCQFSVAGCSTEKTAKAKIRKYVTSRPWWHYQEGENR